MHVALLWLINEKGEVLISQRAAHLDSDSGVWGPSVSGVIEAGESPLEAAIREAQEELGLVTADNSPVFLHDATHNHHDGKVRNFSMHYLRVPRTIIQSLSLDPNEVADVKWVSLAELQRLQRNNKDQIIVANAEDLWESIFKSLAPVTAISQ